MNSSRAWLLILCIFGLTRALVLWSAFTAPQHRDRADAPTNWWPEVPLVRWDGGHYWRIATSGYPATINDTAAFFPGYPLFARLFFPFFSPFVALVVATHVAGLAAVLLFFEWGRRCCGEPAALAGAALLCCYPPAMFFSVAYADALFIALLAGVLCLLQRGRSWGAAALCGLASATRPTGIVVAVVVACWTLASTPLRAWWRRVPGWVLLGLLCVSGLLLHAAYLWWHYGRADAYFAAQGNWAAPHVDDWWKKTLTLRPVLEPAWAPIKRIARGEWAALRDPWTWNYFWNLLVILIAAVGLLRPRGIPRVAFLVPLLQFALAWSQDPATGARLVGIARYQLAALPCFLLVGTFLHAGSFLGWRRGVLAAICLGMLALQCVYVAKFCDWILVS